MTVKPEKGGIALGIHNPDGVEIKKDKDSKGIPLDGIPFHPYYTIHDIFGLSIFMIIFAVVVFFAPELGGYFLEYNNYYKIEQIFLYIIHSLVYSRIN